MLPSPRMTALRILIVYETMYPLAIGGLEVRNYELAAALGRRGHRVTLAGFGQVPPAAETGDEPAYVSLGPPARLYGRSGRRSLGQALRFARAVSRLDVRSYDVVETPNMPFAHLPVLAARCRLARRPLVVSWLEYWGPYWRDYAGPAAAPLYRAVERLTAHLGSTAYAVSALTAARVEAARGAPVAVIPCGLDLTALAAAAAAPRVSPPLVYAGRLLAHKRLDVLLRALRGREWPLRGPLLDIYGEGPDRRRLEDLVARLALDERVRFRGHVPTQEQLWRAIAGAELAVQPSAREGFGLFPLEAMALGVPVVHCASPESAVGELVRDGVDGVCVPASAEALGAQLAALLNDPERRRALGRAAAERATGYGWDRVGVKVEGIFSALPSRRS